MITFNYDEQDQFQEVNSIKGRLIFEYDEHHHLVKFANQLIEKQDALK